MQWMTKIKNLVLDILFPPACPLCQKVLENPTFSLCSNCFNSVPLHQTLFCSVCLARLPENKKICHLQAKFLLGPASDYSNDSIRKLIFGLKYNRNQLFASSLAEILSVYLQKLEIPLQDFHLMAVPLHFSRERDRGFNQSGVIANLLGKKLNLALIDDVLFRSRSTASQADLEDWDKRKANIEGCFSIDNPEKLKNQKILLVDDVFTSGATLREASCLLKKAGAKQVIGLVVAKARN